MTPEERQLLEGLFDRIHAQASAPRDPAAESFIAEAVRALPFAPYLLAQTVIVQDHALQAANARLQELEQKVQSLQSAATAPTAQPAPSFLGDVGRSLFGAGVHGAQAPQANAAPAAGPWGAPAQPAPPPAPPFGAPISPAWGNPGAFQPSASPAAPAPPAFGAGWGANPAASSPLGSPGSFLHGALGAAAGVAGGMLLADSVRGLFSGGMHPFGMAGGLGGGMMGPLGMGGGETVINNYYETNPEDASVDPDRRSDVQQSDFDDSGSWSGSDDSGGSFDV